MSDRRLIRRTIVNMLKNALEASPVGTGVSAGVKSYGDSRVGVWVHNSTTMGEEEKLIVGGVPLSACLDRRSVRFAGGDGLLQ